MTMNHVHLAAGNLAATRAFYERFFDFRLESQHGDGLFLRDAAGFLLALDPSDQAFGFPSWFHLGFCKSSAAEVLELYDRFRAAAAPILRELRCEEGQYASFFVADPDGLRIEVSWHAPEPTGGEG